jgi:hypothetical protein
MITGRFSKTTQGINSFAWESRDLGHVPCPKLSLSLNYKSSESELDLFSSNCVLWYFGLHHSRIQDWEVTGLLDIRQ